MEFKLNNQSPLTLSTACLVIGVFEDVPLQGTAKLIDEASGGRLSDLVSSGDIDAERGFTTLIHGLEGTAAERILVLGLGQPDRFDRVRYTNACMAAGKYLRNHAVTEAHVCVNEVQVEDLDDAWSLQHAVQAFDHADYRYTTTKAAKDHDPKPLQQLSFQADDSLLDALNRGVSVGVGSRRARELGNLPPNICTPAFLAETGRELANKYDRCDVEILDRDQMAELGMEALLAVGQGSTNLPYLVVLKYNGAAADDQPYVLVGKGVTFDTGGISLKPREGMEEMKYDMCGAAGVIGTFESVAHMQLDINLITVVAAVENMPDGNAYRPGDVIGSMAGKTIEILNTDAEGRLALCDALQYSRRFNPAAVIDVATLTGACVVALGHHASAVMTKDDDLAGELVQAGQNAVDRAWQLPLWEDYQQQLKTPFADMKNVGGVPAGAITAGCFLSKFTKDLRWAHVDIAGSAWKWNANEGATGRPVGMLTQYLIDRAG